MTAPSSPALHHVKVSGDATYAIDIGPGLLADAERIAVHLRGRHALIVSDGNVAPLYADALETALRAAKPKLALARYVLPPGEHEKTLARFGECLAALAFWRCKRVIDTESPHLVPAHAGVLAELLREGLPA